MHNRPQHDNPGSDQDRFNVTYRGHVYIVDAKVRQFRRADRQWMRTRFNSRKGQRIIQSAEIAICSLCGRSAMPGHQVYGKQPRVRCKQCGALLV